MLSTEPAMGLWPKPAMVSLDEIEKTDSVLLVCGATPFCMFNCSRWYWRKTEDQAKPGRAKLFSIVSASIFSQFFYVFSYFSGPIEIDICLIQFRFPHMDTKLRVTKTTR